MSAGRSSSGVSGHAAGLLLLPLLLLSALAASAAAQTRTIEKCGDYFFYYDVTFMRAYKKARCFVSGMTRPQGYTVSRTPPDAEVPFIEEYYSICHGFRHINSTVISRGRQIPRHQVTGKPYTLGNYMEVGGRRFWCRSVTYKPPSTAVPPAGPGR